MLVGVASQEETRHVRAVREEAEGCPRRPGNNRKVADEEQTGAFVRIGGAATDIEAGEARLGKESAAMLHSFVTVP